MRAGLALLVLAVAGCLLGGCRSRRLTGPGDVSRTLSPGRRTAPGPGDSDDARAFTRTADRVGGCAAIGCCPASARLRPSDGWAYREAWRTRPLASDDAEWWRCACAHRARKKSAWLAGITVVGVAAYGVGTWNWGSSTGHIAHEGYFGADTTYGGADKAGHLLTGYIGTALFSWAHRGWGLSRKEAAWRGAATSWIGMAMIEVGDSLSEDYGFSFGDLVFDTIGCAAGYLHEVSPWFHRTVDVRWEYVPTKRAIEEGDTPTGDYDGSAFLVAVNVGALASSRPGILDLLDLQAGYQVRGYTSPDDYDEERWIFAGVGLNLANLLRRVGFPYAAFFDYYQAPYISLRFGYEMNDGDTGLVWPR